MAYLRKAANLIQFASRGYLAESMRVIYRKLDSVVVDFGLCRDLGRPFQAMPAGIPVDIRPLRPDDDLSFLNPVNVTDAEAYIAFQRRDLLNLHTCYVAIAPDGNICYMQCLIGATENDTLCTQFNNVFPTLAADEALMEGAYTVPAYRGKGIMSYAMAQIAEKAVDFGAWRVITFVATDNTASLKGCERAGFFPYTKRTCSWRWFNRKVSFEPIGPSEQ